MGGLYSHTTRGTGTILTAAIYNSDHQNHITNDTPQMMDDYSSIISQMQAVTDPYPGNAESLATSLSGELERLRYVIKGITGKTQWYMPPAVSMDNILSTIDVTDSTFAGGAKGDGITDDTAAIQAAFDSVAATGGKRVVYFPNGTYLINGAITLSQSNIVIRGEGDSSIVKSQNSSTNTAGIFMPDTGLSYITFKDITIDGNSDNNTLNTTAGIYALNTDNFVVENCIIRNCPQNGISLVGATLEHSNFRIENNRVYNIGWHGIQVNKARTGFIQNNLVKSTGNHGIVVTYHSTDSPVTDYDQAVLIRGNIVDRSVSPTTILSGQVESGMMIMVAQGARQCIVDGNLCYDNRNAGSDGIASVGAPGDLGVLGVSNVISNNVVVYAGGFGIDATNRSVVNGNVIYYPATDGIVIAGDLEPVRDGCLISNNLVWNPNESNTAGTAGIALNAQDDPAIGPFTWRRIRIINNTVVDGRATKQVDYGILINTTNMSINNIEVSGNDLYNVNTESLSITDMTKITFARMFNNYLLGSPKAITGSTPYIMDDESFNFSGSTLSNLLGGYQNKKVLITFTGVTTIVFASNPNFHGNTQTNFVTSAGDAMIAWLSNNVWYCTLINV